MTISPNETKPVSDQIAEMRQICEEAKIKLGGYQRTGDPVVLLSLTKRLEKLKNCLAGLQQTTSFYEKMLDDYRALAGVVKVINSSLHPDTVLNEVMDTIIAITRAERGFMMLGEDQGQLDFRVARNMERETLQQTEFEISRTIVSRVAASGQAVLTTNAQEDPRFNVAHSIQAYQLRSILCVPLKLKGVVTGVIYADNRALTGLFTERDRDILAAFADQAAIAIENAQLYDGLQQSKDEVELAYDATLEGWALALDLRDKETEGHTRRVTEFTIQLAQAVGVDGEDLVHVKRGALLHDIGKIGIPDAILQKPGPLTDDEWLVMRRHPDYAYEMLSHIPYLRPSLDIPYCHHEKWDGSGYPRGLRGEQIPQSARIFSIVDVWDALCSDRYYRKAWPKQKVLDYIREQSGIQFDPRITDVFLGFDLDRYHQKKYASPKSVC